MISLLLTIHVMLFGIKLWAVAMLGCNFRRYHYMFFWSAVYLVVEGWFLHKFFIDINLDGYEVFAIVDQAIFTIGLIFYLTKEVQNGKRSI